MDMSGIWDQLQDIGGDADVADWRTGLDEDSRQRIVNKITETLKRHLPFSGEEGLREIKKIAIRFEEKTFASAISQSDYLRKISLKMLSMETTPRNPTDNSTQVNAVGNTSQNTHDPGNGDSMYIQLNI
ncbi:mediator of RNA polymerase II transcription subunit 15a-like isoform X2 [Olea europaea var. sylvestris]|uniref:mediator of RNA polymerase II transcription subunit 15a-like isoform X2 n=1 Tax=Olea europaea var. sylvestris TaxID=158386 RepID=UPI000C1D4E4F|nr:mediator of RNA polymerase II transcription subunit 15a-like isoform X2 [Olea europaea var. sylvestris]XP_022860702.1 mediator of RNA polymerase II transcription subunit 15a-like isoform X2 [Olea europaea var. sylvestris]